MVSTIANAASTGIATLVLRRSQNSRGRPNQIINSGSASITPIESPIHQVTQLKSRFGGAMIPARYSVVTLQLALSRQLIGPP